jgi:hypothetical protein
LIAAVAPRAFLIGAAREDYVPLDGVRRTYAETRRLFEIAGVPDHFGLSETPGPHALNLGMREACYSWMRKHLAGETGDAREQDATIEAEPDLRCTGYAGTLGLPGAQTVFDLNRSYSRRLESSRRGDARPDLGALLNLRAAPQAPRRLGENRSELGIESEPGIVLPAKLSGPDGQGALLILVAEQGCKSPRSQGLVDHFVRAGYPVLGLDLRGWGESRQSTNGRLGRPVDEDFFAVHAIEFGRSLLGMRVEDLLAAVQVVRGDYAKIFAVGLEGGGLVGLHAAALDRSISGVATFQTLVSYQAVLEQPLYTEPLASFVPSALAHYDLAQLAKGIAPRPCVSVEARDPSRRSLQGPLSDAEAARAILSGLRLLA